MDLSPSTYYYKPKISRAEREKADADLKEKIEYVQEEYSCRGYRTIRHHLRRHYDLIVNPKKIRRIMRKYSLMWPVKRKFIRTTDSDHGFKVYPNLLKGLTVTDINQVWVADITYIRILTGFVFLAVILDVFSRRVVGWAIGKRINHDLTLAALKMAIRTRNPSPGVIHHSDRGIQYACTDYIKELRQEGCEFRISMSAKGNPYDNAYAETFFKTLKQEEVYLWDFETFTDVIDRIPEFIEAVYNRKRIHSGINYLTPVEFETILLDEKKKKTLGQPILILPS